MGARVLVGGTFAFLLRRLTFDHACLFSLSGKKKRLALRHVPIPRGSESPVVRSHSFVRLSSFAGLLLACAFLAGDSDGVTERRGVTENGVGGTV